MEHGVLSPSTAAHMGKTDAVDNRMDHATTMRKVFEERRGGEG